MSQISLAASFNSIGQSSLRHMRGIGPRVLRISCPKLRATLLRADHASLALLLAPGGGRPQLAIEFGGLTPGGYYRTGAARYPLLKADAAGTAVLRVRVAAPVELWIRPARGGA